MALKEKFDTCLNILRDAAVKECDEIEPFFLSLSLSVPLSLSLFLSLSTNFIFSKPDWIENEIWLELIFRLRHIQT